MPPTSVDRDLTRLEADLKQLEAEYNMYFSGRLPKPPWETRSRVESLVKQYDRAYIQNTGDRFRFTTLQSRFAAFIDLWDRGMRAREEGRGKEAPARSGRSGSRRSGGESEGGCRKRSIRGRWPREGARPEASERPGPGTAALSPGVPPIQ